METKASPGNWRYSENGNEVTTSPIGVLRGSERIADVSTFCKTEEEVIANGKILAASKDLLEALIEYVEESKKHIPVHSKAAFCQLKAERAIKKATE